MSNTATAKVAQLTNAIAAMRQDMRDMVAADVTTDRQRATYRQIGRLINSAMLERDALLATD